MVGGGEGEAGWVPQQKKLPQALTGADEPAGAPRAPNALILDPKKHPKGPIYQPRPPFWIPRVAARHILDPKSDPKVSIWKLLGVFGCPLMT